jgi:hypothetical protein
VSYHCPNQGQQRKRISKIMRTIVASPEVVPLVSGIGSNVELLEAFTFGHVPQRIGRSFWKDSRNRSKIRLEDSAGVADRKRLSLNSCERSPNVYDAPARLLQPTRVFLTDFIAEYLLCAQAGLIWSWVSALAPA